MKTRITNWNARDDEKSRKKALELCENARGQLVLHYPFVGHLGLQIDFIPVVDSRIRTIATNGKVIYIRPEWIIQLPMVTRAAIIAHTIWTAALCHSFRRGNLEAGRFDAASDLEVYSLLKAEKVNMAIKPDYADLFLKHQTVEEIFKDLPENVAERSPDADVHLYLAGQINLPELPKTATEEEQANASQDEAQTGNEQAENSDTQSQNGEEEAQNGDGEEQNGEDEEQNGEDEEQNGDGEEQNGEDEEQNGEGEEQNGEGEEQNGDGEEQNGEGEEQNGEGEEQNGEGEEQNGEGEEQNGEAQSQEKSKSAANGGAATSDSQENGKSSDEEPQEVDAAVDTTCDPMMREVWRQRILETAQNYEMMHGILPGGIAEIVQQFRESKIDYMQKLRRYLTLYSGGETKWLPPAKRFVWQKMYLPSHNNGSLEAVLAIDTSGSTQPNLEQFFGDILKIMRQFGRFHLTVIQCDAEITDVQEYTEDSRKPKTFQAKGGGCTSFVPVFEYIEKERLRPRLMLYLTDGCGNAPEKAPDYPVIWVLTPDGQKPCDWGDVIQIPEDKSLKHDENCE